MRSYGDRVRYVRQENTGAAGAFNHGLRLAAGRYISWLSHDDRFLPEKLERQTAALAASGGPAVCYTDFQMIDPEGRVIVERRLPQHEPHELLRHLVTGGEVGVAAYSVMYERRCVEEVGFYSETWRYTEDAEMMIRLARRFPFVRVPETLMQIREHAGRTVGSKPWEREVVRFYRHCLDNISLEELFPELGSAATGPERARAFLWLADTLATHPSPLYHELARRQYLRALSESPTILPALLTHYLSSFFRKHPSVYKLGLRSAVARRLGAARRRES